MLISDPKQVTPTVLTAVFRANGFLSERERVTRAQHQGSGDSGERFSLRYADFRTQRQAPDRIFVKLTPGGGEGALAEREVTFYNRVLPPMLERHQRADLRIPRCFDAYYDEDTGAAHILLEDLGADFRPHSKPEPPTQRHREQVIDSLAVFHAFWWEHDDLGTLSERPTEATLAQNQERYQQKFAELDAFAGERLNPLHRDLLQQIVQRTPAKRHERLLAGQGLTLVHRDLHPGNFLYSHKDLRILDWQSWRADPATDDLAYMIACFWPEPLRRFHEEKLLRRYHEGLRRAGVTGYTWDDLQYDYRASIARAICFLLAAWTPEKHPTPYWKRIENALNAFDKLDGLRIYAG